MSTSHTYLPIDKLRMDGGTQTRVALVEAHVDDLVEVLEGGGSLPPVTVYRDEDGVYWLADGFHRVAAHKKLGKPKVRIETLPGDRRAAVLHAAGANAAHGLKRTNADKRRSVEVILADSEWSAWSNMEISRRCGVSEFLVRTARADRAELAKGSLRQARPPGRETMDRPSFVAEHTCQEHGEYRCTECDPNTDGYLDRKATEMDGDGGNAIASIQSKDREPDDLEDDVLDSENDDSEEGEVVERARSKAETADIQKLRAEPFKPAPVVTKGVAKPMIETPVQPKPGKASPLPPVPLALDNELLRLVDVDVDEGPGVAFNEQARRVVEAFRLVETETDLHGLSTETLFARSARYIATHLADYRLNDDVEPDGHALARSLGVAGGIGDEIDRQLAPLLQAKVKRSARGR